MKVLFISNYRDGTGWAIGSSNIILALDKAGVDIVCRPIKLNQNQPKIPDRLEQLEQKSTDGCDVIIQYVLPHMAVYNGDFKKNIIMYNTETSDFNPTSWMTHINLMDHAFVFSEQSKHASIDSSVTIPISVISHCDDLDKYKNINQKLSFGYEVDNSFKFYWIGEINQRKNLEVLLKAFHTEFNQWENVNLIIKTTNKTQQQLQEITNKIKGNLKLYPRLEDYNKEIFITGYMDEPSLLTLHNSCDAFVCPSSGETWSYPTFAAYAMGKEIIAPLTGGFTHYLNRSNCWAPETKTERVYGETETFFDLFTGYEEWQEVDMFSLCQQLRDCFENKKKNINPQTEQFDHLEYGKMLKAKLEDIYNE